MDEKAYGKYLKNKMPSALHLPVFTAFFNSLCTDQTLSEIPCEIFRKCPIFHLTFLITCLSLKSLHLYYLTKSKIRFLNFRILNRKYISYYCEFKFQRNL